MGEEEEEEVEEEQWGGRAGASRSRGHQGALECVAEQEGWIFIDLNTYIYGNVHTKTHTQVHTLTHTLNLYTETDRQTYTVCTETMTCACT